MDRLIEHSVIHRRNAIIIAIGGCFLVGIFFLTCYLSFTGRPVSIIEQAVELALLLWLIKRAGGKYTYEVDKRALRVTKQGIFGRKTTIEIPFREMIGVYQYAPKLVSVLKFRRTFLFHSSLDGRTVWTVAYTAQGRGNRQENRRLFFKPSEEMLDLLAARMPGKVRVSEETVVTEQLSKEK
ncbi:MAG TPA: hypothetical protein PKA10_19015 [Selenomonadales bacterium]|nr:hypothetical protein [Selenomonadales bacterium]